MQRLKFYWRRFKDAAIVFSFAVNIVLIVVLVVTAVSVVNTTHRLKTDLVEPLLARLDSAFIGLGRAQIDTDVTISEPIDIVFDLPVDQPMPIGFDIPIEQDIDVVLTRDVPLSNMPARFSLPGGGGVINGTVSLALPKGLVLPIHLGLVVPVTETIRVQMDIPVSETVPIDLSVPFNFELGGAGLEPAVEDLRDVIRPLREQIGGLPDESDSGQP